MQELRLVKDLRKNALRGHPWIYDRAIARPARPLARGELVLVSDKGGRLGVGFADPDAPIRVRLLDTGADVKIDAAWVFERARCAARARANHPRLKGRNALRAIHGEGDGMPGLVIDLYAGSGVVRCDGESARVFWSAHLPNVFEGLVAGGLAPLRFWSRDEGCLVGDAPPPPEVEFDELGARFAVDLRRGHKTSWFLDQAENRLLVRQLAAGKSVLDLFCYAGGFSVQAGLGGARRLMLVDQARPALDAARANLERNQLADRASLSSDDAFEFLASTDAEGRRYELVICDPPSFAPRKSSRDRALAAYARLNQAALRVVAPSGWFMTASCSSHVTSLDLEQVVAQAAAAENRRARIVFRAGAGPDHPTVPGFPEWDYLTFFGCAVDG